MKPGWRRYVVELDSKLLDLAMTQARSQGSDLAKEIRQLVWELAQATPALDGMPRAGILPQARQIAASVHRAHRSTGGAWEDCMEPECRQLRDSLDL